MSLVKLGGGLVFRPENKLRGAAEFERVFKARSVIKGDYFSLHWCRSEQCQQARIGFVVSKRFVRFAVYRNTVKRVAREVFRQQLPSTPSIDFVFRIHRKPGDLGIVDWRAVVRQDVERLLKAARHRYEG